MVNKHYEKYKDKYKEYRDKNKPFIKRLQQEWYKKNKDKVIKKALEQHDNKYFGGLTQEVLKRDNYSCTNCGMSMEQSLILFNERLTLHHKDFNGRNSNNPNNTLENLTTLCIRCHTTLENKIKNKGRFLK